MHIAKKKKKWELEKYVHLAFVELCISQVNSSLLSL